MLLLRGMTLRVCLAGWRCVAPDMTAEGKRCPSTYRASPPEPIDCALTVTDPYGCLARADTPTLTARSNPLTVAGGPASPRRPPSARTRILVSLMTA